VVPKQIAPIETYDDHRMAMAFGPVCMVTNVEIEDPDVVKKSYPGYWEHMKQMGVKVEMELKELS
jgi:3-phosphoshikimate 1-carboxyvinyltransferase